MAYVSSCFHCEHDDEEDTSAPWCLPFPGRVSAPAEPSPNRTASETATSSSYELVDETDDGTVNAEEEYDDDDDFDDDDDDEEGDDEDDDEDEGEDLDVADEAAPVLPAGTEEDFVEVGYFMSTHGLRGDLRVRSLTDFPEQRFGTVGGSGRGLTGWVRFKA